MRSELARRLGTALRGTRTRVLVVAAALVLVLAAARELRARQVPGFVAERREVVQRVVASGRVMPLARIGIGSVALGRVSEVLVDEGDRVRPGQLLVRLDRAEPAAALLQARARVAAAAARLDQVRGAGSRSAVEALAQAELRVAQAEGQLDRARQLLDAGSGSSVQLDDAEKVLGLARSQRDAAAAQAASLAGEGADRRLALAALDEARGAETAARARLDETELRAPAAAVVIEREVEPGDVVAAGRTLLALAREGETLLSVTPDEKNLALLRCGQRAAATADAFPDAPFEGEVTFIAPAVDPLRGTVEVRVRVSSPPPFLRPDLTVSVNVEVGRRPDAVVLPAEAIRDAARAPWVLAVANGRAARREVRLGLRGEGLVEVAAGLAAGDAVVAPSAGAVAPGERVRVAPLPPPPELGRAL